MKTLPLLLASACLSAVLLMTVEPASASEPATKQGATKAAAATSPVAGAKQAGQDASKAPAAAAADKDDSAVPGGKVPSPADVAKSSAGKGTPQRFTPSEQVRPDFDVSFPIDI